jgi:hypothetical protein
VPCKLPLISLLSVPLVVISVIHSLHGILANSIVNNYIEKSTGSRLKSLGAGGIAPNRERPR